MKKTISVITMLVFILSVNICDDVQASELRFNKSILVNEYFDNGDYLETYITEFPALSKSSLAQIDQP